MLINNCRVCHQSLLSEPLLSYENMPKSAQFFPDKDTVKNDKGEDLDIYQCSGCGLIQLNKEPVDYYKQVIRAAGISEEMTTFRQSQFSQWIKDYSLIGKKILEVGCGAGEYLKLMDANNVQADGIEHRIESVERCLEQGLSVKQCFIDSSTTVLDCGPYDAFFMLNFLEHLPDPNATLVGICNNLKDDAVGVVEVPNFDMILRKNLFSEFISDHLFYFTKETLISTLSRSGFEIIECNEVWHEYSISAVIKKRKKTNLSIFSQHQSRLTKQLHEYIDLFPDNSVAIWGAGHQALAVMSLTQLGGRVKYVIDSATFKQKKYTPATHIPIVSPDNLNSDPVNTVIVMAASYSDEVRNIIKEKYSRDISIVVLREDGLDFA